MRGPIPAFRMIAESRMTAKLLLYRTGICRKAVSVYRLRLDIGNFLRLD